MTLGMIEVFKGAGLLIYPLGACSAIAVFIIFERIYALRSAAVLPPDLVDAVMHGRPLVGGRHTVLSRIVEFAEQHENDADSLKAFARLEVNRMERGVPVPRRHLRRGAAARPLGNGHRPPAGVLADLPGHTAFPIPWPSPRAWRSPSPRP